MTPKVAFIGMTHLGLVSATAVCAQGFETLCLDPDPALVERLSAGQLPVTEPDLDDLLKGNGGRQSFSSDFSRLADCDVAYIAADVPTDDRGESDLSTVRDLIARATPHLGEQAVLVVLSQVPPGFTRGIGYPAERLFYQVETLIFGRAVERAREPERYIVGCAEPSAPLPPAYEALLSAFGCPILPMRYESAELAKISINVCLVASVAAANTMAEVCEAIGADWQEIVPALRLDRRIGPYAYINPGLGIAGGNLERDLATVLRLSEAHDTDGGVVSAWLTNSRHRRDWAAETLRREQASLGADPLVAVWGLAYKENTHSVKNSPSLATLAQFPELRLRLHDPVVPAEQAGHPRAEGAPDPLAAAEGADALMILTPWADYRAQAPAEIAARMNGTLVIDPYRVLAVEDMRAAGLDHLTLGVPPLRANA